MERRRKEQKPVAAGKSSFDLVDPVLVFDELGLTGDTVLLDDACGVGRYSIGASHRMQGRGMIHAVDLWEEGIAALRETIAKERIRNINPVLGDVSSRLPLEDNSIDICLMATVVHDLIPSGSHDAAIDEVARTLKPGGRLAVIEFKKIEGPPGPPIRIRLAPEELDAVVIPHGFGRARLVDVGPYNYMCMYALRA